MTERLQGRVRYLDSRLEEDPAGGVTAEVGLATAEDARVTGTARRQSGDAADLWCVAEAAAAALREVLQLDADALTVKDVVAFPIDDSPAVAVALRSLVGGERRRLFGLCKADEDRLRATTLAVLSATNRFFADG